MKLKPSALKITQAQIKIHHVVDVVDETQNPRKRGTEKANKKPTDTKPTQEK